MPRTEKQWKRSMAGIFLDANVQLHGAAASACDYFLTSDKALLKLGYFGHMSIVSSLPA